jgi:signal transduction histidine kinase
MFQITSLSLDNEMDIVVAHKRVIRIAEILSLSLSTQTTLATAVAEVSREVTDKTDTGVLAITVEKVEAKYYVCAEIRYSEVIALSMDDTGLGYAQKLVPQFAFTKNNVGGSVLLKMGIPRSSKITDAMLSKIPLLFLKEGPETPYEEVKEKYSLLHKESIEKDKELLRNQYLDEKKTEFISIASHELKTPLTIIRLYTQLAISFKDECSEKVLSYLKKVELQTSKMMMLMEQLLDVSKMETGQLHLNLEKVNATEYLTETFNLAADLWPDNQLDICIDADSQMGITIDRIRIEQVLNNLIGNASKYSEKGSAINIRCSANDKSELEIIVADKGIGMSAESVKKVFDKFYREKGVEQKYSGLGMGLYIASKIVQEHHGTMWVESIEHTGSSFHFTLPLNHFTDLQKKEATLTSAIF